MNNSQPKEIQDKINRIKKEMLDKTNMTENEAYDFAFKCWQCGLDFTKDLEKENQTLNEALDFAKVDYTTARINLDNASARIKQLEKENQDLKDKLNSEALDNWQLHCKYGKYKKAIEILKKRLNIEFDDKYNEINFEVFGSTEIDYVYFSLDDKQEYELLKEMLDNE